jgi:predicted RNase H-like nuclease (RuvC/YqgF family)
MTTMKHKSADAKRTRRNRYKAACKPIMERFGCTSMQVAEVVRRTFAENKLLRDEIFSFREEVSSLREHVDTLKKELLTKELHTKELLATLATFG